MKKEPGSRNANRSERRPFRRSKSCIGPSQNSTELRETNFEPNLRFLEPLLALCHVRVKARQGTCERNAMGDSVAKTGWSGGPAHARGSSDAQVWSAEEVRYLLARKNRAASRVPLRHFGRGSTLFVERSSAICCRISPPSTIGCKLYSKQDRNCHGDARIWRFRRSEVNLGPDSCVSGFATPHPGCVLQMG